MITLLSHIFPSGVYLAFDPLTIATLVMSLAGGVGSLVGSAQNNKTRESNLQNQKASSDNWYNKEYYQNELDRTENQAAMRLMTDKLKDSNKRAQATEAITGATPEATAAREANSAKAYSEVVTRIASNASNRKSGLNNIKRADDRSLYMLQDNIDVAKGQNWSNLGSNAAQLGANALMLDGGVKASAAGTTGVPGKLDIGTVVEEIPLLG